MASHHARAAKIEHPMLDPCQDLRLGYLPRKMHLFADGSEARIGDGVVGKGQRSSENAIGTGLGPMRVWVNGYYLDINPCTIERPARANC